MENEYKTRSRILVILDGKNEDSFFIEANEVMNCIENSELVEYKSLDHIRVCMLGFDRDFDMAKFIREIERDDAVLLGRLFENTKNIENYNVQISAGMKRRDAIYYLRITQKEEGEKANFDVTSLRYLPILRRRYEGKIYIGLLVLGTTQSQANEMRISHYMFLDNMRGMNDWESRWEKKNKGKNNKCIYSLQVTEDSLEKNMPYNQIFFINNQVRRIAIHGIGSLNKIIPCVCLDWDWYNLFADSVCLHMGTTAFHIRKAEDKTITNDFIYKLQERCFKVEGKTWNGQSECKKYQENKYQTVYKNYLEEKAWRKLLYDLILQDICIDNLSDAKVLTNGNVGEIQSLCRNMSMLSLLLFSSLCHFIYTKTNERLSQVDIRNLILSSQDFADGLLQLMENALEYAEQSSFSFRIHQGDSEYLKNKYEEFYTNGGTYYLEVLITDINYGPNITDKFVENMKKRRQTMDMPDMLLEKIEQKISLSGFFAPDNEMSTLWDEYYQIAENVTNHYGLQLFDTLVSFYRGFFMVASGSNAVVKDNCFAVDYSGGKGTVLDKRQKLDFPGTQYSILLPIERKQEQKRIGINIRPDFKDTALKQNWTNNKISIDNILRKMNGIDQADHREWKRLTIRAFTEACNEYFKDRQVFVIDVASCYNLLYIELFSKAMITFILHNQKKRLRIALINGKYDFMTGFTKCFSTFYNKKGECAAMEGTQLFLCDGDLRTEITFAGKTLSSACASNEFWAAVKGEYNPCLEVLQIILKQRSHSVAQREKTIHVAPFELLVKDGLFTLFEKRVYNDLMYDIQKEQFGCCLNQIHMRVGSKMHVTDHFFEPAQLFNSSLYNSRFAYLLAKKIYTELARVKKNTDLVLVGYDVYSEFLVIETKNILKDLFGYAVRCVIYEQTPHPHLRF